MSDTVWCVNTLVYANIIINEMFHVIWQILYVIIIQVSVSFQIDCQ
jgi:hypothetical protein